MELTELILRIALGFAVLFCLTRIMGRKEISQMTFFKSVLLLNYLRDKTI